MLSEISEEVASTFLGKKKKMVPRAGVCQESCLKFLGLALLMSQPWCW